MTDKQFIRHETEYGQYESHRDTGLARYYCARCLQDQLKELREELKQVHEELNAKQDTERDFYGLAELQSACIKAFGNEATAAGWDHILDWWKGRQTEKPKEEKLFVLRLYDMFDGWIDVSDPLPRETVESVYNAVTANGTKKTKYSDGDYYRIFPADTKMFFTPETMGR